MSLECPPPAPGSHKKVADTGADERRDEDERALLFIFYLLSRCMRPEGPWQRLRMSGGGGVEKRHQGMERRGNRRSGGVEMNDTTKTYTETGRQKRKTSQHYRMRHR